MNLKEKKMARKIKIVGYKEIGQRDVKDGRWRVIVYKKENNTYLIDDRKWFFRKDGLLTPTRRGLCLPSEEILWHLKGIVNAKLFVLKLKKDKISNEEKAEKEKLENILSLLGDEK